MTLPQMRFYGSRSFYLTWIHGNRLPAPAFQRCTCKLLRKPPLMKRKSILSINRDSPTIIASKLYSVAFQGQEYSYYSLRNGVDYIGPSIGLLPVSPIKVYLGIARYTANPSFGQYIWVFRLPQLIFIICFSATLIVVLKSRNGKEICTKLPHYINWPIY